MHKMTFHFCRKLKEKKNNYYLVFGDKNYVFFFKNDKYYSQLPIAQEHHAALKEHQSNGANKVLKLRQV